LEKVHTGAKRGEDNAPRSPLKGTRRREGNPGKGVLHEKEKKGEILTNREWERGERGKYRQGKGNPA